MQKVEIEYQDIKDNNLFTINPFKPYRAKGFFNPTTGDVYSQPWFCYEHKDNMIGYLYYNKFGDKPHKFIGDVEFGEKEYKL